MKEREISTYKAKLAEERIALQTLKDCHQFLETKLGVKTSLRIDKIKFGKKEPAFGVRGMYNEKYNIIFINLYNLKGQNILRSIEVLAHEFRHAVQFKNKWLKGGTPKKDYSGYWKGKKYNVGYYDSPWEIDARKYEDIYAKSAIDSLNLKRKSNIKI
jgi:hypothetical protein